MTAQMVLDGDPDKVNVSGYTKGDVLAANTAGTLTPVPIGTNTEVLTADSSDAEGVDWASGSGGTPSGTVVTETAFGQASTAGISTDYSRGDHTHGTPAAPTAASVGADPAGSAAAAQTTALAAVTAITPRVRKAYITTGNVTPPNTGGAWAKLTGFELAIPAVVGEYVEIQAEFLNEPKPSTFLDYAIVVGASIVRFMATGTSTPGVEGLPGFYPDLASFKNMPGPVGLTVQAGDLDGGNVRWVLASASTSGAGTVFASANFPFFWRTVNYRTVL